MCYSTDRLLPYLTVEETLYFATTLKMGQCTDAERKKRVDEVVNEMSLDHVRHTQVGGVWRKELSTGEVRRTSIAVELIGDPAVLLLDEPTSGLDAALALEIMLVLKALATKERTIICSLHQPRIAIYDMFDSLMLMSNGRCIYHGPAKGARPFVTESALIAIPDDLNTADALIEVASAPKDKVLELAEHFRALPEYARLEQAIGEVRLIDNSAIRFLERNKFIQWFMEVYAVTFRTFRNSMRNPLSFSMLLLIQACIGLFLGSFFFNLPKKFGPATTPVDASDPGGPLLKFFDTPIMQYVRTGIDGTGYDPLLELLVSGPDGNMSEPFLYLSDTNFYPIMYSNLICAHEKFDLDTKYEMLDFSPYRDIWGETGEGDDVWALGSSMSAPVLTEYLLTTFQTIDYLLGQYDWTRLLQYFRLAHANAGVSFTAAIVCRTDTRALIYTMAICGGTQLPPILHYQAGVTNGFALSFACTWANKDLEVEEPLQRATSRRLDAQQTLFGRPDLGANADLQVLSAKKRSLQFAAFMSGTDGLEKALPPVLAKIISRLQLYQDAFSTCNHELCSLAGEEPDPASTTAAFSNMITALSQYGSVMGALLNIVGALFFAVANTGFAAYDALVSIPQDRIMVNREMANNCYRPSSYFVGKCLADVAFQLVPAMVSTTCFYFLIGVPVGTAGYFYWRYLGIIVVMVFAAYGFAYLVSAMCPSMEVAVIAAPLVLVIFHACAGFFVRDTALPVWMSWIKYLSYYRWGFFGLVLNQFPEGSSFMGLPNSFSLALVGVSEKRMWLNCVVLVILGFGYRFLAYIALRFMHRRIGIEH
eukprot:Blabericola_migrator_1__10381@NODE_585_length_7468_cov_222_283070_g432_i0_p1_GENE_NODE_585_length_7468_cov_222_283070_g432_i0NODE_585_length_7468_cov_222_283070_g432_i0_p1_ORF_typecomplete_len820_score99_60ABC2_membrane/PF01061_24/0_049ABC2_membrane/PF01061_24/5_2e29ABC_tran/PF00005_27/3_6e11ABC2_membrane_3/PF12698_7/1_5e03ABC2_membrane_3/PF12698_7/2_9e10AAA_21/PF13304_6/0_00058CcmB/PF03379_13/0_0012ABC2_membrane_2/PF12679_7/2_4e03ABC2_membrane_2/PF12679_7/1_4e02ABC2_membrane_2/PF12679_7/0_00046